MTRIWAEPVYYRNRIWAELVGCRTRIWAERIRSMTYGLLVSTVRQRRHSPVYVERFWAGLRCTECTDWSVVVGFDKRAAAVVVVVAASLACDYAMYAHLKQT